jgi:hypothetical protein
MSLDNIHGFLADAVILYTLILGIWGVSSSALGQGISEAYWIALVIGEMLVMTQGLLGAFLWSQGQQPAQGAHVLYGAAPALGIPAVYVVSRGREGRKEILAYGIVALLITLLTFQAIATA